MPAQYNSPNQDPLALTILLPRVRPTALQSSPAALLGWPVIRILLLLLTIAASATACLLLHCSARYPLSAVPCSPCCCASAGSFSAALCRCCIVHIVVCLLLLALAFPCSRSLQPRPRTIPTITTTNPPPVRLFFPHPQISCTWVKRTCNAFSLKRLNSFLYSSPGCLACTWRAGLAGPVLQCDGRAEPADTAAGSAQLPKSGS